MRYKLTLLCVAMSTAAMAQLAPGEQQARTDQQPQQQGLLSRLRSQSQSTRQQLRNDATEIAQPANSPQGYAPGVTFPQRQAQPQQPQYQQPQYQQPQYQQPMQPGYPAYPPQQMPYNVPPGGQAQPQQQRGAQPTATPASGSRSGTSSRQSGSSSSDSDTKSRSGSSASRSSSGSSSSSNRSSAASGSGGRSSSSSTSAKPSSSSSTAKASDDAEKSSAKSSSSSALEKIVKKVESDKVESDKADEKETAETPKKSEEEIAAEKARATALKAADEATTVVAGFLKQANDGYYSKATEDLAPAIQKYFESEISAVNGTQKTVLDELTANGTITMVTYINTTVRGEGAVVEAELGYEDGRTARRSFDLVKIKDDWKIVLPVTEKATVSVAPMANNTAAEKSAYAPETASIAVTQPGASLTVAPPPTAEQAAAQSPLVLAPGTEAETTTGSQQ